MSGYQLSPALASNGEDWLVVWQKEGSRQELRGARVEWMDVYGARVSATSQILDPMGLPLFTESYGESYPAIASAGPSGYLVTYSRIEERQVPGPPCTARLLGAAGVRLAGQRDFALSR